ncbi:MAG TPA: hypothetical protein VGC92_08925 [Phenylobacterium sp.]|jgi:hypothetical protein
MTQPAIVYNSPTSDTVAREAVRLRTRPGDASDRTTPKFARHGAHVRAVLAAGGFAVLARP